MISSKIIIVLLTILTFQATSLAQTFTIPAEWEEQEKVWLTWFGHERRDSTTCRVIEALQAHVKVAVNVTTDSLKASALKYMANYKIEVSELEFITDKYVDYFTRDYVVFTKDKNGNLKVVCFDYSAYGMYPDLYRMPMPEEEKMFGKWDERLAKLLNVPTVVSDYVFEGGGIESNGSGTILVIKEMALQRNPTRSIPEIESEIKRTLGATTIIWLEKGFIEDKHFPNFGPFYKNYFGGGANMHIDELCRFVDKNTVVLPYISEDERFKNPIDSINYHMLETNLKILQGKTTSQGKKLKIVRIPVPEMDELKFTLTLSESDSKRFKDFGLKTGDTIFRVPAASYCNFFISNEVVLIPKYWKRGMSDSQKKKDQEVKEIFAGLFPNRHVIQVYALSVNRGGGGIHCMTHELPVSSN